MMHRFAAITLMVGSLLLGVCSSSPLTKEFNVEERFLHMQENYDVLKEKVVTLERTVEQLLSILQHDRKLNAENDVMVHNSLATGRASVSRTCREVREANPSLASGMYWIDPDGQGVGEDAIYVHCNMDSGTTSVLHDTEAATDVGHCADPGCYTKEIHYSATSKQITALISLSSNCQQSIKYECTSAPFEINGITYSWWNDRTGNPQYFWAGSNSSVHTCQCGIDNNCIEPLTNCNCDSGVQIPLSDNGVINEKNLLPITRLNFGRTIIDTSSGVYTLGRLECSGEIPFTGMPTSCFDLWLIGHTLSGMYSVKGAKSPETVYCDFTKRPEDSGFQTWIGYEDVKSLPVYFYVQKNSTFSTFNTPVPFETERLNVGGAMNPASGIFTAPRPGIYHFSLSGISSYSTSGALFVALSLNGGFVGQAYAHVTDSYETFSLQAILRLKAGDRVWLYIVTNSNLIWHDHGGHFTHFTGWLSQEESTF